MLHCVFFFFVLQPQQQDHHMAGPPPGQKGQACWEMWRRRWVNNLKKKVWLCLPLQSKKHFDFLLPWSLTWRCLEAVANRWKLNNWAGQVAVELVTQYKPPVSSLSLYPPNGFWFTSRMLIPAAAPKTPLWHLLQNKIFFFSSALNGFFTHKHYWTPHTGE